MSAINIIYQTFSFLRISNPSKSSINRSNSFTITYLLADHSLISVAYQYSKYQNSKPFIYPSHKTANKNEQLINPSRISQPTKLNHQCQFQKKVQNHFAGWFRRRQNQRHLQIHQQCLRTKRKCTFFIIQPTIGIDFLVKNMTYKGATVRVQLWDTAGQ